MICAFSTLCLGRRNPASVILTQLQALEALSHCGTSITHPWNVQLLPVPELPWGSCLQPVFEVLTSLLQRSFPHQFLHLKRKLDSLQDCPIVIGGLCSCYPASVSLISSAGLIPKVSVVLSPFPVAPPGFHSYLCVCRGGGVAP